MAGILPSIAPAQTFPSGDSAGSAVAPSPLDVLNDFNASQGARDIAALQLIGPRDASARERVLDVFRRGPDASKLALARALAVISWPDPEFQQPLMTLLGERDSAAGAAAAPALAQYRDDPGVMRTLIDEAQTGRDDIRLPVIRALGTFGRRPAAETLLYLLEHDDSLKRDAIREAAGDALIAMTGRTDLDHNVQQWEQWRDSTKGLSDQQFNDLIVRSRGAAFEGELAKHDVFENAADELLKNDFFNAPLEKRVGILLGYLQSPAPEIRKLGADLVLQSAQEGEALPGMIQQTRQLLWDPSPEVRAAAASALSADIDSAGDLVAQLRREPDDFVRVRIIRSLARAQNKDAIEQMLNLVGPGQSDSVRIAAADGIRDGSAVINADADLKRHAIETLKTALVGTDVPSEDGLRAAIVGALSQISDQQLSDVFAPLILPTEPKKVRANALVGLGNLPYPAPYGSQIARMLEDQEWELRLAAAQALRRVPPEAYIGTMLTHLANDPSDQVRSTVWIVLQDWAKAPDADEANIGKIADGLKSDPAKELVVRQILCNRLLADAQNAALPQDRRDDAARQRAEQEQNVGDLAMKPAVNQPLLAIEAYKSALDYWKANNGQVDVITQLSVHLIQSYLAFKRWDDAANFASQVVKDAAGDSNLRGIPPLVAREFQVKATDLKGSSDPTAYTDAMHMFDAVDKMDPPFPGAYPEILKTKRQDIEAQHGAVSRPGT